MENEEITLRRLEMIDKFITSCDQVNKRLIIAIIACVAVITICMTGLGFYFTYHYFSYNETQEVYLNETGQGAKISQGNESPQGSEGP